MSANKYLIDASTRHQIMLQRLSGGSFNKLKPLLDVRTFDDCVKLNIIKE